MFAETNFVPMNAPPIRHAILSNVASLRQRFRIKWYSLFRLKRSAFLTNIDTRGIFSLPSASLGHDKHQSLGLNIKGLPLHIRR